MIPWSRAQEIIAAFTRQYKLDGPDAIKGFTLTELRETEAHLGDRDFNSGHRLLIRQRIAELEAKEERKRAGKARAVDWVMRLLIALTAFFLGTLSVKFGLI